MLSPDGVMMRDGWGAEAMFPPIPGLAPRQHNQPFVVMVPPNLRLMFAPGAVSYTLPIGPAATFASGPRHGRWLDLAVLSDYFAERAAAVRRREQDLGAGRPGQQRDAGREALARYARRRLRPARNDARSVQRPAPPRVSAEITN